MKLEAFKLRREKIKLHEKALRETLEVEEGRVTALDMRRKKIVYTMKTSPHARIVLLESY